jgi:hypothetical protein
MGIAPTPILVSTTGTGNPLDGSITRDAIDDLVGAMSSHLLIYLYANKITPGTTAFVDRLGNTLSQHNPDATKNSADSNFGGHPSITLSSSDGIPFTTTAGGFGIGTPPISGPTSFSVVASLRVAATANAGGIYGDGISGTSDFYLGMGSSGNLIADISGTLDLNVASFFAANTTYAFFYSYDSATKIHRYGVNSTASLSQTTGTGSRTTHGTSTFITPFSQPTGGFSQFTFNRWIAFNKAYLNGAVPSDDAAFANLVSAYAAYL